MHAILAEWNCARANQPIDNWSAARRTVRAQGGAPRGRAHTGNIDAVLERHRHAVQCPKPLSDLALAIGLAGRRSGTLDVEINKAIQVRMLFGSSNQGLDQRFSADLAATDRIRRFNKAKFMQFRHRCPRCTPAVKSPLFAQPLEKFTYERSRTRNSIGGADQIPPKR